MCSLRVEIINRKKKAPFSLKKIEAKAKRILELLDLKDKTLSLVLTDDNYIRDLNRKYLNKNRATDVLSFSLIKGIKIGDKDLLGDVVISLDTAARQSKYFKRSLEEEFYLYLIHGILHLIGYKDRNRDERNLMEKLQNKILDAIM